MKLTKKQVLQMFRDNYVGARGDVVMRREAWNNFTDALCKSRQITPTSTRPGPTRSEPGAGRKKFSRRCKVHQGKGILGP